MKKNIVCLLIGLMSIVFPSAICAEGESHWQCENHSFEYDMSMFISVYQQGSELDRWEDLEIAAFCGDECRGVAVLEQVSDGPKYYYLRVRSNQSSDETITFKCFDSNADKESAFPESVTFESLKRYGYPSEPFVLNLPFISVTEISLDKSELTLNVTQKAILTASILPTDAFDKRIIWKTSDESIVSVDQYGELVALKEGQCVISASTIDELIKAECHVTVLLGTSLSKTTAGENICVVIMDDYVYVKGLVDQAMILILGTNGQIVRGIGRFNSDDKLEISDLTPGLYFIIIKTSHNIVTDKFIKE